MNVVWFQSTFIYEFSESIYKSFAMGFDKEMNLIVFLSPAISHSLSRECVSQ